MKRCYTTVTTAPAGESFAVELDHRPLRTPGRLALAAPTGPLAEAVAEEWRAQGETIAPHTMPLTRLVTTVVDHLPARREDAIHEAWGYAGTDLLCYRAEAPEELVRRQRAEWQPWLDWAERQYDARLVVGSGINPLAQPEPALDALCRTVGRLDDWRLIGLHAVTTLLGSLVLGLAAAEAVLDAETAFRAGLVDELYEIEQWGEEVTQQRRHADLRRDLGAAFSYLRLL